MAWLLHDDITGELIPDGEGGPVRIALDGQLYEIDLSTAQRAVLHELLAPYIDAGRAVPAAKRARARTPKGAAAAAERPPVVASPSDPQPATATEAPPPEPEPIPQPPAAARPAPVDRPRPEQVDLVEQLLDDGRPLTEIATATGLAIDQVREIRTEIGAGR